MPFIAKAVADARRAAARLAAERAEAPAALSSEPTSVPGPVAPTETVPELTVAAEAQPLAKSAPASPKLRGHAMRDENNKFQPTGDYEHGFARPPLATRFQKGGKPGPGRPKGSVSFDRLLKRQLEEKRAVRLDGRERKITMLDLIVMKTVHAAVEGKDRDARKYVLTEGGRLFVSEDRPGSAPQAADLSAADALSMTEFMDDMRAEIRAELERELRAERDAGHEPGSSDEGEA